MSVVRRLLNCLCCLQAGEIIYCAFLCSAYRVTVADLLIVMRILLIQVLYCTRSAVSLKSLFHKMHRGTTGIVAVFLKAVNKSIFILKKIMQSKLQRCSFLCITVNCCQ